MLKVRRGKSFGTATQAKVRDESGRWKERSAGSQCDARFIHRTPRTEPAASDIVRLSLTLLSLSLSLRRQV